MIDCAQNWTCQPEASDERAEKTFSHNIRRSSTLRSSTRTASIFSAQGRAHLHPSTQPSAHCQHESEKTRMHSKFFSPTDFPIRSRCTDDSHRPHTPELAGEQRRVCRILLAGGKVKRRSLRLRDPAFGTCRSSTRRQRRMTSREVHAGAAQWKIRSTKHTRLGLLP